MAGSNSPTGSDGGARGRYRFDVRCATRAAASFSRQLLPSNFSKCPWCISRSTIVTSNRPVDDWARLLGDTVVVTPLLDRLMHHGHLLKFDGKSWRLREAAARVAKRTSNG